MPDPKAEGTLCLACRHANCFSAAGLLRYRVFGLASTDRRESYARTVGGPVGWTARCIPLFRSIATTCPPARTDPALEFLLTCANSRFRLRSPVRAAMASSSMTCSSARTTSTDTASSRSSSSQTGTNAPTPPISESTRTNVASAVNTRRQRPTPVRGPTFFSTVSPLAHPPATRVIACAYYYLAMPQ
jgi:hypothetical protein